MAYVKLEDVLNIIRNENHNLAGLVNHIEEHCPTADVAEVKHGEWVPVTDRLPKSRRKYLCICVFGESELQYYEVLVFHPEKNAENGYVTGPHFSNEGMNGMRVTHWMPLPKPPCGAKMDGERK